MVKHSSTYILGIANVSKQLVEYHLQIVPVTNT